VRHGTPPLSPIIDVASLPLGALSSASPGSATPQPLHGRRANQSSGNNSRAGSVSPPTWREPPPLNYASGGDAAGVGCMTDAKSDDRAASSRCARVTGDCVGCVRALSRGISPIRVWACGVCNAAAERSSCAGMRKAASTVPIQTRDPVPTPAP
jgi:hypothetical protein